MTEFGELDAAGTYTPLGSISQDDMLKCPFKIMVFDHYREDGTCKCDDAEHRAMMIRDWEYSESDFAGILLR